MSGISVKICGLKSVDHITAAAEAGARYIGFNFFAKSPRSVDVETARMLALEVPEGVAKVALLVDPDDAMLDSILTRVPLDMVQLHGGESIARVQDIKSRFGLPVMKVLGIAGPDDVARIAEYEDVADQILVDAKAPKDAELPGGNGLTFDWRLLAGRKYWRKPWMLAGGLTPDNVAEAIRLTGTRQVDVASGVETAPGVKDARLIADFVKAAQSAI